MLIRYIKSVIEKRKRIKKRKALRNVGIYTDDNGVIHFDPKRYTSTRNMRKRC